MLTLCIADSAALCVSAGEDSQQQCSAESRLDTDNGTSITQSMDHLMAPNYNCWELAEERIPEDKVNVCEWSEQDFYSLGLGMGFHQISVRLLGWLLLNHIQVTLAKLPFPSAPTLSSDLVRWLCSLLSLASCSDLSTRRSRRSS